MKLTFRGNLKLRGNVKVKRRVTRRNAPRAGANGIRRAVRAEIRNGINQIRQDIRAGRIAVRRDLRGELFSDRFANFIRRAVANNSQLREIAQGLLNQNAEIATTAGNINGTVIEVGNDYVVLQETPNTILVVPFRSVVSIQPL